MSTEVAKLRIWHIINVPGEAFRFDVPDVAFAIKALRAIWSYDNFLGDGTDKPMTTVGARLEKRRKLAGTDKDMKRLFKLYDEYQLTRCPGGVPLVSSNASGLEMLEDGEWLEWEDEEGRQFDRKTRRVVSSTTWKRRAMPSTDGLKLLVRGFFRREQGTQYKDLVPALEKFVALLLEREKEVNAPEPQRGTVEWYFYRRGPSKEFLRAAHDVVLPLLFYWSQTLDPDAREDAQIIQQLEASMDVVLVELVRFVQPGVSQMAAAEHVAEFLKRYRADT